MKKARCVWELHPAESDPSSDYRRVAEEKAAHFLN
jgi:hypothetical protein